MALSVILQISIAWIYGLFFEYAIHRWVLHSFGMKRANLFSFHFHEHHAVARRNAMHDDKYVYKKWEINSRTKELIGLMLLVFLHTPIAIVFPWAFATIVISAISYYRVHLKSHVNVEWARIALSWHYDHHMGPNQNKNFGVRSDFFDKVFNTRSKYYGTRPEKIDYHRRVARYSKQILRKRLGKTDK